MLAPRLCNAVLAPMGAISGIKLPTAQDYWRLENICISQVVLIPVPVTILISVKEWKQTQHNYEKKTRCADISKQQPGQANCHSASNAPTPVDSTFKYQWPTVHICNSASSRVALPGVDTIPFSPLMGGGNSIQGVSMQLFVSQILWFECCSSTRHLPRV